MSGIEEASARIALKGIRVAAELVIGPPRSQEADWAQLASIYLLVTGANVPIALAARAYGASKQYVSRICREVEDRREDPVFDGHVAALERRIFEGAD